METERKGDIESVICGTRDLLISNSECRNWERSVT